MSRLGRSGHGSTPSLRSWRVALVAAVGLSVATFVHIVATVSRHVVTIDSVMLWFAAPEWAHLRFHEPAFYGQEYGSTVVAAPMALLHALGIGYSLGLPVTLGASMLACWFGLGWAAWRRGHPTTAVLACAAPALLSSYYAIYVTVAPAERAFAAVGVGAAMLIGGRGTRWVTFVAVALVSVGTVIDISAVVLVLPVALWWLLTGPRREALVAAGAGVAVGLVYVLARSWFYAAHPDYNSGGLPVTPKWSILWESLGHPYGVFRMFSPELLREWWAPIAAGVVIILGLLVMRRWRLALPAVLVAVVTGVAISTPRALDGAGLFLPPARILLFVPLALWFLVLLAAESGVSIGRGARVAAALLVVLAAAVSFGERLTGVGTHDPAIVYAASLHTNGLYSFYRVAPMERRCRTLEVTMARHHVEVAVLVDAPLALLCASGTGNRMRTLALPYERRTWVLHDLAARTATRLFIAPAESALCPMARRRNLGCERVAGGAVVTTSPRSVLDTLTLLGLRVRPFGPGCVLADYRCVSGTDARRRFPTPTGAPRSRGSLVRGLRSTLDRLGRGDASAAEPGVDRDFVVPTLAHRLEAERRRLRLRDAAPTSAVTARARVSVGGRVLDPDLQFVRTRVGWQLANRSLCELAAAVEVRCNGPYPYIGL